MNELVERLTKKDQPVLASRADGSAEELKKSIERGYVHIKFTETRGGTELGVRLDNDASQLGDADFENGKGQVHLEGTLTLNYDKVRCFANIDLEKLAGTGHLEILEEG